MDGNDRKGGGPTLCYIFVSPALWSAFVPSSCVASRSVIRRPCDIDISSTSCAFEHRHWARPRSVPLTQPAMPAILGSGRSVRNYQCNGRAKRCAPCWCHHTHSTCCAYLGSRPSRILSWCLKSRQPGDCATATQMPAQAHQLHDMCRCIGVSRPSLVACASLSKDAVDME